MTDASRTKEQDTAGPPGTYGCVCECEDPHSCYYARHGRDAPQGQCDCLCHKWRAHIHDDDGTVEGCPGCFP
jgi:hypothetical protein